MPVRVLAYSHDGYGLGHFRRNLRIAAGLRRERPDTEVVLATGASAAGHFDLPPGIARLQLPPVVKVGDGRYEPEDPAKSLEETLAARAGLLEQTVRRYRPDLLLVDRYPLGLRGELAPALRAYHARDRHRPAVLGLRDVLDSPERVREEWASGGHSSAIREHFSSVLVYGDRDVYDPVVEYGLPADIAGSIEFTGYLTDDPLLDPGVVVPHEGPARFALGIMGGGRDAFPVADGFLSAMERLRPSGWAGLLVAGPYMDMAEVERLRRRSPVPVLRMVHDAPGRMAISDVVVCMGGYNTVCEVLSLTVPAVVVPRDQPRQEQLIRAERLAARGVIGLLPRERLAPGALARCIDEAGSTSRAETGARRALVRGNGVAAAASHLAGLLAPRRYPAAAASGNGVAAVPVS